ncbi:FtsX-like permease family protein [Phytohabitans flavus]
MAAQIRQVGTLKAIGVTPGQVTMVLLAEYLTVAGLAAAVGLAAGQMLTPMLAGVSLSLYGSPQAPPVTWERAALVVAVAVAVVLLATVRPALRGARRSTLRSLATSARPPRRSSRVGGLASRLGLPLPVVLGLRSALRRPGRVLANAAGLTLGVAMVVIGLGLDRSVHIFMTEQTPDEVEAPGAEIVAEVVDRLVAVVYAGAGLLLALAAVNAVVVAVFAARDSARNHAILRTVGATPRQTMVAFVVAQLGGCLLACAAGIPLGVLLFNLVADDDLAPIRLTFGTYAAVAVIVPLVYAAIVAVPARLFGSRPVTPSLSYQ